ncbi:MAG: hypothetical protein ACLPSW_02110, partial [Roseiarcus sp.]
PAKFSKGLIFASYGDNYVREAGSRHMTDDDRKADYEKSAHDPLRWRMAAENLFEAAAHLLLVHENAMREIIEKKAGEVPPGFYMDHQAHYFEGKCIELYVKCLLINSGTIVTKDGKMVGDIKTHKLIDLCQKAGFQTSTSETETLEKLTEAIMFWGTYPIPTSFKKWRPNRKGIGGVPAIWFWSSVDMDNYINVVRRLKDQVSSIGG